MTTGVGSKASALRVGLALRTLFVTAQGYATQRHQLELAKDILRSKKDPVRVRLQTGATIKACLIDNDGDPMPFKIIQLNRGYQRIGEVETDESGIAWFHNLSSGSYHLYRQGVVPHAQTVGDTSGAKVYVLKIKERRRRKKR